MSTVLATALLLGAFSAQASSADEPPAPGANQKFRAYNEGLKQRLDSNHNSTDQPNAIVWAPNNQSNAQVFETLPVGDAFQIKVDTGECLAADGVSIGSKLPKTDCNDQDEMQLWQFDQVGDIAYIHPEWSKNVVVTAVEKNKPVELRQRTNNNKNQHWLITSV